MGQTTNGPPGFDYLGPIPHKHSKCTPKVSFVGKDDYLARFDEGTNETPNEKGAISHGKMTKRSEMTDAKLERKKKPRYYLHMI